MLKTWARVVVTKHGLALFYTGYDHDDDTYIINQIIKVNGGVEINTKIGFHDEISQEKFDAVATAAMGKHLFEMTSKILRESD